MSEQGPTEGELIRASVVEPDLFSPIFERHFDRIFRYLARRLNPSAAEELAAETFVQAFVHRERFDPTRQSALPWLYGIATNLSRHHRRRERARMKALSLAGAHLADQTTDSDSAEEATAALVSVLQAMETLQPPDRDVLLLYAWEDLSYSQIADALGIPIGTVRSRLNRVRAHIRERVGPEKARSSRSNRRR